MQYVRTHQPTTIFFLFFARVRRRTACRCAPWRATGARRAVRMSPRVGGSSSRGVNERPQHLRPSAGALPSTSAAGCAPPPERLGRLGHSGNDGATPTVAFATAQTGGLEMGGEPAMA